MSTIIKVHTNFLTFNINTIDRKAEVIGMNKKSKLIFVPRTITFQGNQYLVTKICERAFSHTILKKIEFASNSGIEYIGKDAFSFSKLERITIPQHVKVIDEFAFTFCKKLKSVIFECQSELYQINKEAFAFSTLEHIHIPANVEIIGEDALGFCKNLRLVEMEENSKIKRFSTSDFIGSKNVSVFFPD